MLRDMEKAAVSGKRPWFGFHRSTVFLMIFFAGALLWRNTGFRNYATTVRAVRSWEYIEILSEDDTYWTYGWPAVACTVLCERQREHGTHIMNSLRRAHYVENRVFDATGIAINLSFGLLLLTVIAFLFEALHRRRARKSDEFFEASVQERHSAPNPEAPALKVTFSTVIKRSPPKPPAPP